MNNFKRYYMNAAELMDEVFEIYKKSIFKQIGFSICMRIILLTVTSIIVIIGAIPIIIFTYALAASSFLEELSVFALILLGLVLFLLILAWVSFYTAIMNTGNILISKETFAGKDSNLSSIMKTSLKKMFPVASVILAEFILMIPLIIIFALVLFAYLYGVGLTAMEYAYFGVDYVLLLGGFRLTFLLLFIFSILFSTLTMMAIPIAIFEKKYFFSAIKKSFQLCKKDFLKLLAIVTVWVLIARVLSYGIIALRGVGSGILSLLIPVEYIPNFLIFRTTFGYILSILTSVFLAPLSGIFPTVMYINQKIKYEGYDLELYLEGLQEAKPDAQVTYERI